MIAPVSYIQALATIRRERTLPVDGEILVKIGDEVHPADAVGRASLVARHLILDASRALGMPQKMAANLIQRMPGEHVEAGTIIAGKRGVGNRQLRAPAAGQVAAVSGSQILLQISDESSLLQARIPGQIIDVDPGRSVTIECTGAWVQGMWGNNHVAEGILRIVGESPTQPLTADQIDMSQRGAILVAGVCEQRQALELAAQVPVRGLVLGSLATRLLPLAEKLPYPIVLIEGFGTKPLNENALKLFSSFNGQQATENAQSYNTLNGDRPEVIIPLRNAGQPKRSLPLQSLTVGQSVRVLVGPDRGLIGDITELLPSSTYYPSGLHGPGANVRLPQKGVRAIPLVNLELLG